MCEHTERRRRIANINEEKKKMGPEKDPKADTLRYFTPIKKMKQKKSTGSMYYNIGIVVAYVSRNEYCRRTDEEKKSGMQ